MYLMDALLVLEDGAYFPGMGFGASGETFGEIVFNTSMTGYQEILTDPSYKGQIITMTYPQIGNYGVNNEDEESKKPHAAGFVVKEKSITSSNWRARSDINGYLKKHNIIGISEIDTRALTRRIRDKGAMRAGISTTDLNADSLLKKVLKSPSMAGRDLVRDVTCEKKHKWSEGVFDFTSQNNLASKKTYKVIVYDFGVKFMTLRILHQYGCEVTVVPAFTSAEDVISMNPDGILLSNGPGDPAAVSYAIESAQKLVAKFPIFGICLGHQILSLAFGGKTYKLKFGHRGANHPVKNLMTGKIEITSQNHGFCADPDSFKNRNIEITHINLNDYTCEGIRHKNLPVFSVQYHPEASPGPHDSNYLFRQFIGCMEKNS